MSFLLLALVVVIITTLVLTKLFAKGKHTAVTNNSELEECCGAHDVCDKDSLIITNQQIDYYQDEELDRFSHNENRAYLPSEIMEFNEILLTLREDEVAGWLKSLQLRSIELPQTIKDDALLIISERRYRNPQ